MLSGGQNGTVINNEDSQVARDGFEKRLPMENQAPLTKRKRNLGPITIDDEEIPPKRNQKHRKVVKPNATATKCTTLFQYGSGKTNISLSLGDVEKLSPEEYLNDSIIEFYLRYLSQECYPANDDLYIFNTFLFPRLISHPTKSVTSSTIRSITNRNAWLKKNYESVKRWTRGVDIFSKKFLVIPVNNDDHWYVIIVQNPSKAVREGPATVNTENQPVDPSNVCTIFVFNSLRMVRCPILKISSEIVKEYLTLEFADKNQQKHRRFSRRHVAEVTIKDISGQRNLFDCGVFLLAYTELFLTWTPKINNLDFNFNERWPLFQETQMVRMRYKILKVLKSKVSHEMWKSLEDFEAKEHEDGRTTEQRLLDQLEKRGLRRVQSHMNIREIPHFKKRSKSLDRVDKEDHLNPTWDPIFD